MRLMVVSNNQPDQRPLSEYGYHLARGLSAANPDGNVQIMSGRHSSIPDDELRVWKYGSIRIPWQVVKGLERHAPDAVLINTHFTNWGGTAANFAGLLTPLFVKRAGYRTITLVHHLPQTIDAKRAGYRLTPFHRAAIDLACRAIAHSDEVCFLLQRDLEFFQDRYNPRSTHLMHHGILGKPAWAPPPGSNNVLAFGNWGRSKNPVPLLRIFKGERITGSLVVAGGASHTRRNYLESLKAEYTGPNVSFTGYVPDDDLQHVYHNADLVVLPYEENTGVSGVLLQTCQYGRVPLIRRLPVFEDMVTSMGLTAFFYDTERELEECLGGLLSQPQLLVEGGYANFQAVKGLTMEKVAAQYWSLAGAHGKERDHQSQTRRGSRTHRPTEPLPADHPLHFPELGQ